VEAQANADVATLADSATDGEFLPIRIVVNVSVFPISSLSSEQISDKRAQSGKSILSVDIVLDDVERKIVSSTKAPNG
jgi:hypothetical protein